MLKKLISTLCIAAMSLGVLSVAGDASAAPSEETVQKGKKAKARGRKTFTGTFDKLIYTSKGKLQAIQLKDGSVIRVPPKATLGTQLAQGDALSFEARETEFLGKKVYIRATIKKGSQVVFDAPAWRKSQKKNRRNHHGK